MRRLFIALSAVAFVSCSNAADFVTTDGLSYSNATLRRVDPDGITIMYPKGIVKITFDRLPKDIQQQYEYDPVKAEAFKVAQAERNAEAAKAQQAVSQQAQEQDSQKKRDMDDYVNKVQMARRINAEAVKNAMDFRISALFAVGDDGWVCSASKYTTYTVQGGVGARNTVGRRYDYYGDIFVIGFGDLFYGKTWEGTLYPAGTITVSEFPRHVTEVVKPDGTRITSYSTTGVPVTFQRLAATAEIAAETLINEKK